MKDTKSIIGLLTDTERRHFTNYLSSRNKRHDTRNIQLFQAYSSGEELSIRRKIGGNAFNALKKRLDDSLLDFLAGNLLQTQVSEEVKVIKLLLTSRKLFAHEQYKEAFQLAHKAESKAQELGSYSLLNELYHTLIEHSHHPLSQDQTVIFDKLQANNASFMMQERLNMVYASIRKAFYELEQTGTSFDFDHLLKVNYEKYRIPEQDGYTFQTLYQLAHIADITGAYSRNYHSINLFFESKISALKGSPNDIERFLNYHIDLLYSVANIYFRKKQFDKCKLYLDEMYQQMQRYNRKYHDTRIIRYTTLYALNENFTGNYKKAEWLLDQLNEASFQPEELLAPQLTRVMIHFQQDELESARKLLTTFYRSDSWYEKVAGKEWCLHRKYIEILLYIELGDVDFADARIQSLTRKYRGYFKTNSDSQILPFLKLVKKYYHTPDIATTEAFINLVEKTTQWKTREEEDLFLMSFYAWLKSKMTLQPLYETTLELVNNRR